MATPITPETRVHLLSVPLENNMKATLWFSSLENQTNYFLSKAIKSNTDFTYQRKDKSISVPYLVDTIYSCNYVMYQNHNFNNKWFYAFITKMEYVDEETSRLYIETDPIQTWWFDLTFKDSFIEREHTNNDTIGNNVIPEGLETGDYKTIQHSADSFNRELCIVMGMSEDMYDGYQYGIKCYNGIPAPLFYYRFNLDQGDILAFQATIRGLNAGKVDAIQSMFLCPTWLADSTGTLRYVDESYQVESETLGISRISTLDSYTPRNKKLLTFPYCYIALSNAIGQYQIYHQEDWQLDNDEMKVTMYGALTSGCSIRAVPINYLGTDIAWDNGITIGKFPELAWPNDIYTNWLTQNGINLGVTTLNATEAGVLGGAIQMASGAFTGSPYMIGSGFRDIFDTLKQTYKMDVIPAGVEGSLNSGDVLTSAGFNRLHLYKCTIKEQFARNIDSYFDMFGYKTNRVKTPNVNHRKNWWYTKTIDANIVGDIPEEDMEKIKACYNNGITFWKNPANMYDYSVDNSII